ncbi:MAG TPA: LuxR C-terminal-related transcriptional regulator [Baekduia sp.]|nr:LuxR C-terminal-related transcriptional regulator [Baekduia sp.]
MATAEMRAVVLSAPAGYGKTALLRAWSDVESRPVSWVTADRHRAATGEAEADLARVVAALRTASWPAVLVVDDADVAGGAIADQALAAAEQELPASVMLVLSGRSAPPPVLGRLRSTWPVLELDAEDLAMTHSEAAALLQDAGMPVDAAAVDTLLRRTEGWPLGLRLATVAIGGQADLADAVARFGGDDRTVADYVRVELLTELSAERLAFLTGSSILSSLAGPVCDAVLEREDSGQVLFELGRSAAPVAPTDRAEEHFRLHPLVAETLRAELHRADPVLERDVHRRASSFFEERGDLRAAIDHSVAGAHVDRAAALLWRVAPAELFDGRGPELDLRLARIGEARTAGHPALALTAALSALARGDRNQVERWTAAAMDRPEGTVPGRWVPSLDAAAALLRASVADGDVAVLEARAEETLALAADRSPWRAIGCLLRGVARVVRGDLAAARRDFDDGARCGAVTAPGIEVLCLAQAGLLLLLEGDAADGAVLAERARTRIDARGLDHAPTRALVCAVSAFARAYRGRVEEARADAAEAGRLLGSLDGLAPWYDAQARLALARAQLRLGDVSAARASIAEAARFAARMPDAVGVRAWIDDAGERADAFSLQALAGPASLTTAELRVLRFLPSHLSFREIAERLQVSANTVKTQAHGVYRKLDASSRSEAVTCARIVGLLDTGGSPGSDDAAAVSRQAHGGRPEP